METDLTVARTIQIQIGADAFRMMGTNHQVGDEKSLMFNIKGCRAFNKIRVTLDPSDTYTVEFIKVGKAPTFKITTESHAGIYADALKSLIEEHTGLRLTVPRIRGIND